MPVMNASVWRLIREHWIAIVCACLVGVIIVAPTLAFRTSAFYQGVDVFGTDGELNYVAQVHAVYNGDFRFGNVFLYEGKDQPYIRQQLPAILTALLGKALGLTVPDSIVVARMLFPIITFVLVYALCLLLTKRKDVGLLGATFVLLAPATTSLLDPNTWLPLLKNAVFVGNDPQFLSYARPINPQVSNIFFFAYLLSLFSLWYGKTQTAKRRVWLTVLSGVLLGCTFYTYIYVFTLLYAMNGFLWLYFAIRGQWQQVRDVTYISLGGLLLGIPYFLNMYAAVHSPYWADLSVRVGQVITRQPLISRVAVGVLALFLILYRKLDAFGVFVITFVASTLLVSNQQILTGHTIPIPQHYHWYYMAPLGGVILIHIFYSLVHVRPKLLHTLTSFLLLFFVSVAIAFNAWSYKLEYKRFISYQPYGPSLNWLGERTNKDDVIFGPEKFSDLTLAYTPANIFYGGYVSEFLVPQERLKNSYFAYMYLSGVKAKDAVSYFADPKNQTSFSNRIFGNYWPAKAGCYACYPKEFNETFAAEYQTFSAQPLMKNLEHYRITYAVWDRVQDPLWRLDKYFGDPAYSDSRVSVFRVNQ